MHSTARRALLMGGATASAALLLLLCVLSVLAPLPTAAWYPEGPATDKLSAYNKRVGSKFMRDLQARDPRILELGQTGILYRVIARGDGQVHPTRRASVTYHRAGKTIKGRVFEDTWQRKEWPTPLALGGVLGCHQQALERMVVGDEWEIISPPAFAFDKYGARADKIGPHEVLMYKLRLLAIAPGSSSKSATDWSVPKSWVHPVHRHPDAAAKDALAKAQAQALQDFESQAIQKRIDEGRRTQEEEEQVAAQEEVQKQALMEEVARKLQEKEKRKQERKQQKQAQQQQEQQGQEQPQEPIKVDPHGAPADLKTEL